jgi:hypothetical protein
LGDRVTRKLRESEINASNGSLTVLLYSLLSNVAAVTHCGGVDFRARRIAPHAAAVYRALVAADMPAVYSAADQNLQDPP